MFGPSLQVLQVTGVVGLEPTHKKEVKIKQPRFDDTAEMQFRAGIKLGVNVERMVFACGMKLMRGWPGSCRD